MIFTDHEHRLLTDMERLGGLTRHMIAQRGLNRALQTMIRLGYVDGSKSLYVISKLGRQALAGRAE